MEVLTSSQDSFKTFCCFPRLSRCWFQRSSEYRSVLSLLFSQFSCFLLQSVFQLHVWCLMFGLVVRAEIRRQLNWQFTTCGQVRVRRGEWYLRRSCLHIKGLYYSFFLSPSAVPERRATKAQTGSSVAVRGAIPLKEKKIRIQLGASYHQFYCHMNIVIFSTLHLRFIVLLRMKIFWLNWLNQLNPLCQSAKF